MFVSISDQLRSRAIESPDALFFSCDGQWFTWRDVEQVSDEIAVGLATLGVQAGDRIAMLCHDRAEVLQMYFVCSKLGAIHVALSPSLQGEDLRHHLIDSGAVVLLVDSSCYVNAEPLLRGTAIRNVILFDANPLAPGDESKTQTLHEIRTKGDSFEVLDRRPGDLLALCYTSGSTTGRSKGCMLSHGYLSGSLVDNYRQMEWVREDDRIYTNSPFFHVVSANCLLQALYIPGASCAFDTHFSAPHFLSQAAEVGATVTWGTGLMCEAIMAQPAPELPEPTSIRVAVWAGVRPPLGREFERRFQILSVWGYGQTEAGSVTLRKPDMASYEGVGFPSPALEVRIVDGNDHDVPQGEPGEIVVRPRHSNGIFSGYWHNAEATVASWRNLWHHTGDLGRSMDNGELIFIDRVKDVLRLGGRLVSSLELESTLAELEVVQRAAVVAVTSPTGEDEIKACIVLVEGLEITPDALVAYFKASLSEHSIPRYVQIRNSFPLTAARARVQKYVLQEEGITEDTIDIAAIDVGVVRSS